MKNKINELLSKKDGFLSINKICNLHRWQKDGLGQNVDKLSIEFSLISSFDKIIEIDERNYKEIIKRIEKEQSFFLDEIKNKLNVDLRNGYIY